LDGAQECGVLIHRDSFSGWQGGVIGHGTCAERKNATDNGATDNSGDGRASGTAWRGVSYKWHGVSFD